MYNTRASASGNFYFNLDKNETSLNQYTESEQMSSQGSRSHNSTTEDRFRQPQMIVNLDSSRYSDESDDLMSDFASTPATTPRFGRNLSNSSISRRPALSKRMVS